MFSFSVAICNSAINFMFYVSISLSIIKNSSVSTELLDDIDIR